MHACFEAIPDKNSVALASHRRANFHINFYETFTFFQKSSDIDNAHSVFQSITQLVADQLPKFQYDSLGPDNLDIHLIPYLVNPDRSSFGNVRREFDDYSKDKTLRDWLETQFIGQVNNSNSEFLFGHLWNNTYYSDHDLSRIRQHFHNEIRIGNDDMRFPEKDPYRQLYDLVDSENASSFWLKLAACQNNRTKVTWTILGVEF